MGCRRAICESVFATTAIELRARRGIEKQLETFSSRRVRNSAPPSSQIPHGGPPAPKTHRPSTGGSCDPARHSHEKRNVSRIVSASRRCRRQNFERSRPTCAQIGDAQNPLHLPPPAPRPVVRNRFVDQHVACLQAFHRFSRPRPHARGSHKFTQNPSSPIRFPFGPNFRKRALQRNPGIKVFRRNNHFSLAEFPARVNRGVCITQIACLTRRRILPQSVNHLAARPLRKHHQRPTTSARCTT